MAPARLRVQTLQSIPGIAIPGLSSFLAYVVIGHRAGASILGLVSLSAVTANLGSAIVSLGPSHAALRALNVRAHDDDLLARYRRLVVTRSVVAGGGLMAVGLPLLVLGWTLGELLVVSGPWLVAQAWVLFETETCKAQQRFVAASALASVRAMGGWALGVGGAFLWGSLAGIVLPVAAVGLLCGAVVGAGRYRTVTPEVREDVRTIGRPIARFSLASYVLGYADRYVIAILLGEAAVGVYTLAYAIGEGVLELVVTPISSAVLPRLVSTWNSPEGGPEATWRIVRHAAAVVGAVTVLAPVAALALGTTGIFELVGPDPALPTLTAIVCAAIGIQGFTRLGYGVLLARGRTDDVFRAFVQAVAVSAVVVPLLTWRWGIVGAAWATLVGYSALAALTMKRAVQP